jgi:hypothetical protein
MIVNKEEVIRVVDSFGMLSFDHWYKGDLIYKSSGSLYIVIFRPDYKDDCSAQETLASLLSCGDYDYVQVMYGSGRNNKDDIYYGKGETNCEK